MMECGLSCALGLTTFGILIGGCKLFYAKKLEDQIQNRLSDLVARKPF